MPPGFLGVLHMEVFQQRMSQEFDAEVIVTAPTVPYKITVKESKVRDHGKEVLVSNPNNWLDRDAIQCCCEFHGIDLISQ